MPTIESIYGENKTYIKALDMKDNETMELKIKSVDVKDFKGSKKIVVTAENGKSVVINKTNSTRIAEMFGTETDNWVGKTFKIMKSWTTFSGQEVPCIRVVRKLE